MPKLFVMRKKRTFKRREYSYNKSAPGVLARRNYYIKNINRPIPQSGNVFKVQLQVGNSALCFRPVSSSSGGVVLDSWDLGGINMQYSPSDASSLAVIYDMWRIVAAEVTFYPATQAASQAQHYGPLIVYYDPDNIGTTATSEIVAMGYENKKIVNCTSTYPQTFKVNVPKFSAMNTTLSNTSSTATAVGNGYFDAAPRPYFGSIAWYGDGFSASIPVFYCECKVILECFSRR